MNDPRPEGHMASYIARRKFLATLGGAAVAWPLAGRAQQGERVRRIGLLMGVADDREGQARVTALKEGLQDLGWTDGRNIQIETRFGGADAGRIRAHAAEPANIPDCLFSALQYALARLSHRCSSAGYDEPAILSYAISSFCPTSADGLQPPNVRPAIPVVETRPPVGARPKACVSRSN